MDGSVTSAVNVVGVPFASTVNGEQRAEFAKIFVNTERIKNSAACV